MTETGRPAPTPLYELLDEEDRAIMAEDRIPTPYTEEEVEDIRGTRRPRADCVCGYRRFYPMFCKCWLSYRSLGAEYGVHNKTIHRVVNGERWGTR